MLCNEVVSVIMPAYNAEKTIIRAIESVQKQSYANWQLIVVNDGSNDKTKMLAEKKCQEDSKIESYTIDNSGPAVARNYAIEKVKGEWIAFCDADDWLAEDALFSMVNALQETKSQLGVCYYNIPTKEKLDVLAKKGAINQFLINPEFGGYLWNKIFSKDIIKNHNIRFEKEIYICEDLLFVIRYTSYIQKCVVIPQKLYNYDVQPSGLTSSPLSMKKVTQINALEKINAILSCDADKVNAEISKRLLVEKAIFIRRDAIKAVKNGNLKRRSPECKCVKEKSNRICRQYIGEFLRKEDFPLKFKGMMLLYCFV